MHTHTHSTHTHTDMHGSTHAHTHAHTHTHTTHSMHTQSNDLASISEDHSECFRDISIKHITEYVSAEFRSPKLKFSPVQIASYFKIFGPGEPFQGDCLLLF